MSDLDSGSSNTNKLLSLATHLELPLMETNSLVRDLYHDILRSVYRVPQRRWTTERGYYAVELTEQEKSINQRCEAAYLKTYGTPWPKHARKVLSTGLFGPPGHGKTTVFDVAAKMVADDLRMEYLSPERLEHVPIEEITLDTFVLVSQETAGVASALEFMGLPSSEQVASTGEKYMGRLFTQPLLKLMRAGGGVLLLDDFLNAQRQIQDVGLSLIDRRRIGQLNLPQTYFGVTGNLGSHDNTNASRASAALRNRMRMYLAHDTVENFIERIQSDPALRDELGDGFVRSYLHRFPQNFSEHPSKNGQGAYTTPRSLRNFIDEARDCLHRHGGRGHAARARNELFSLAQATIGIENAKAYNSYLESVLSKADPLAREIVLEGRMSPDKIKESYNEGGFSQKDQSFGYQFAMALVDYTVQKVIDDDKLDEAIARFAKGVCILPSSIFGFGMEELRNKLSRQVEAVGNGKKIVSTPVDKKTNRRELTSQVTEEIGNIMLANAEISADQRNTMISVLSEMSKFETRPNQGSGRVARPSKK